MAPVLGVTHLLAFSMNEGGNVNCKVARVPSGPTLSFKVKRFSLAKQVRAVQKRPIDTSSGIFQTAPVVVTNNFGGAEEVRKLVYLPQTNQSSLHNQLTHAVYYFQRYYTIVRLVL